ncbi:DEAD/DEAH box helicase [archaeon]|jgi:ERCC4-related helicase|nr:DEAD/DEAH box helicase [archaeon]
MYEIKGFKPRLYQENIFNTCTKVNTLVVLPTGRGKTKLAILVAVHRLNNFKDSKIVFLTPTKPLAAQIVNEFKDSTNIEDVNLFTGEMKPEQRGELWKGSKVIVSTPQGFTNDVINKRIDLKEVSLVVFDECHRATGDYDYVWLAKHYNKMGNFPRIVGLTASPGSDLVTINEVSKNLFVEDVEVRNDKDEDLKPYVQKTKVEYVLIDFPEDFKQVQKYLTDCFKSKLRLLKEFNVLGAISMISKKKLLDTQRELQRRVARGERDQLIWQSIALVAESIKVQHALELLETQGVMASMEYFKKLYSEAEVGKAKSTKNLVQDVNFKSAYAKLNLMNESNIEHPKLKRLLDIVKLELKEGVKILIFNQYRDSANFLVNQLNELDNVKAKLFVGQMKKKGTGLTQKEQIQIIQDFKDGVYNILVGTSVSEEGLDIPAVDLVLFYEPIPSAIRTVQRRGRTGRMSEGKVKILVTKGTRDEAYRWTAYHKENRMHRILGGLKSKLSLSTQEQKSVADYGGKIKIYADSRERGSGIMKRLVDLNVDVKMQNLDVGDFLISEDCVIERKEVSDFVASIIDKRVLDQVKAMKQFSKPILIIEGTDDIYSVRKVHPNAIRGMLAYIAIDMKIPIIYTKDSRDTAEFLLVAAKREQDKVSKEFAIRGERKPLTPKEQKEFIVGSLPGVGGALAKNLLNEFRSIKGIINASEDELKDVDLVGKKKAEAIKKAVEEEY